MSVFQPEFLSRPASLGGTAPAAAPLAPVLLMSALLVAAPISTKAAGLALFVWLGWALWLAWRRPALGPVDELAGQWLVWVCAVLALRAAATVYWQDSWGSRHFEVRLALSGLIVWCLARRASFSEPQKNLLAHALALACWAALGLSWLQGRNTPTNAIPWAAGVSFMVCVLCVRGLGPATSAGARAFWMLSAWAGLGAVFLSQSRGSFGLLPWLVVVGVVMLVSSARRQGLGRRALGAATALVVVLLAALNLQPRLHQEPVARMTEAHREWSQLAQAVVLQQLQPQVLDTSVGARGYLYLRGWQEIQEAPWLGHGEAHRKAWVPSLGRESGSQVIQSLNHLHSDPLNIALDHGLLGLGSYLCSVLGLVWLAWRSRKRDIGMSLGFAGLAWMHASSGLTNLNTIHNFYGVMLSLGVVLVFAMGTRKAP